MEPSTDISAATNGTQNAMVAAQMSMLARTLSSGRQAAAELLAAMPTAPRSGDRGPSGGRLDLYL